MIERKLGRREKLAEAAVERYWTFADPPVTGDDACALVRRSFLAGYDAAQAEPRAALEKMIPIVRDMTLAELSDADVDWDRLPEDDQISIIRRALEKFDRREKEGK